MADPIVLGQLSSSAPSPQGKVALKTIIRRFFPPMAAEHERFSAGTLDGRIPRTSLHSSSVNADLVDAVNKKQLGDWPQVLLVLTRWVVCSCFFPVFLRGFF